MLAVLFAAPGDAIAQGRTDLVTISFNNVPLSTAIERFEKASAYTFFYDAASLDLTRRVTLEARQMEIKEALAAMLDGTGIHFEISNRQIVLIPGSRIASLSDSNPITVRGTVTEQDTKNPLAGVAVYIKGSQTHAVTDAAGKYSINVPANGTLVFSFLGMRTAEVPVISRSTISIAMKHEVVAMEEVIVTGYQTISKERTTGSFGTITSSMIEEKPKINLVSALEGQVAGLSVDQDGRVAIRGIASFNAGKAPLVVVDGFPVEASLFDGTLAPNNDGVLAGINPDNIESIYILKDAVAASIYGARAANGVIVVTTRKGISGAARVTYKGTFSWQSRPNLDDLRFASPADYVDAQIEMYRKEPTAYTPYNSWTGGYVPNQADVFHNLYLADIGRITPEEAAARNNALKGQDFLAELEKYVFRTQFTQQHNLQITGGSDKNRYNVAGNFTDTRENFAHAKNNRFIFDLGNDWTFNKHVSLSVNVNLNYAMRHTPTVNPSINGFEDSYYGSPLLTFSDNTLYSLYSSIVDGSGNSRVIDGVLPFYAGQYADINTLKSWRFNPIDNLNREAFDTQDFQARVNAMLRINIVDGLAVEVGGTWQRGNYIRKQLFQSDSFTAMSTFNYGTGVMDPSLHIIPDGAILNEMKNDNENWTLRGQLNFSRDFEGDRHRVTALAGMEVRKMTYDNNVIETRMGYNETAGSFTPMDLRGWMADAYYGQTILSSAGDFNPTQGSLGYMDNRFVSYYGNGSYEFNNRYILSGSIRLDLTNFFGTDRKYRYRPLWSVGGTWKLSEENFFNVPLIDKLDLRASYGINGNIALNQGPFLILGALTYSSVTGGIPYRVLSPPNDQLRWEKTASFNAGFDLAMLDNRLRLSMDFYRKNSTDLLAPDNIDQTTGYANLTINAGQIVNQGIEATINVDILRNTAVKWSLSNLFSYNDNQVKTYNVAYNYATYLTGTPKVREGAPTNSLWSYRFAEIEPETGQTMGYMKDGEKDYLGNLGVDDLVHSGTTIPKYELSLTNRFNYRNWDLSFMFVSKLGHVHRKQIFSGSNPTSKYVTERWREPGDVALYPELHPYSTEVWYHPSCDIFVYKSDFVRLRDVTLAYNFDKSLLAKWKIGGARIYVQARNLWLLTAQGVDIDPDVSLYVGPSRPREVFAGLQITF